MKYILIAEDDDATLQTLQYYLGEELGHSVDGVNTIDKALRLLDKKKYDICIFDYLMDKGNTCAPLVKAAKKGSKIVIITAATVNFERLKKDTGADQVIAKPFSLEELEKIVAN